MHGVSEAFCSCDLAIRGSAEKKKRETEREAHENREPQEEGNTRRRSCNNTLCETPNLLQSPQTPSPINAIQDF